MTGKRREDGRACRCDQHDVSCVGLTVHRLSSERVAELAEEIWTASTGRVLPARPIQDPCGSRPGASAQAAYQRRRQQEFQAWLHGWWWRLRFHPSASAVAWRRQAAAQRRTASALQPLEQRGDLVLHETSPCRDGRPAWSTW
jgi:hypothetical protein